MSQIRHRNVIVSGPNTWVTLPIEGARAFVIDANGLDPGIAGAVITNAAPGVNPLNGGRNVVARVLTKGGESIFYTGQSDVFDFAEPILRAEIMVDDPTSAGAITYPCVLPVIAMYGDATMLRIY